MELENEQTNPTPSAPDPTDTLTQITQERDDAQTALAAARADHAAVSTVAIAALRAANPVLPPSAFEGDSVAAVQANIAAGLSHYEHFKAQAATNGHAPAAHIPAGASPAPAPVFGSALQKIVYGLQNRG